METTLKIVGIVGSLRKESLNRKAMENMERLAPEGVSFSYADLESLPLYNGDMDVPDNLPEPVRTFKEIVGSADGVIISTPEYNRSVPGVLKNAIDWGSRPYGDNTWNNKPVGVMGVSMGRIGTAVAQSHLKQILQYLDAKQFGQPELYLGELQESLDEAGNITDEKIVNQMRFFWKELIKIIELYK